MRKQSEEQKKKGTEEMKETLPEKKAEAFLLRHGMLHDPSDMESELKKLLAAMEKDYLQGGRNGRMIPFWIGELHIPPDGEKKVTVIDIGGTNVRAALGRITPEGTCRLENRVAFRTPGIAVPTDTAGFFGEIVEGVQETLTSEEIGLCFSLAAIPGKDRDAQVVAGGKQIQISDLLGKKVGESFLQAMRERGLYKGACVTVVNDTVAAALGGQFAQPEKAKHASTGGKAFTEEIGVDGGEYAGFIGFIYGTGVNLCYRERAGEWVNMEAATFQVFTPGDLDDRFDTGLVDPGCDRLEKMVSGGYQGGLMSCVLETAAKEGLLSEETWNALLQALRTRARTFDGDLRVEEGNPLLTSDLSAFSLAPDGENLMAKACKKEEDRQIIAAICDAMTDRCAQICSVLLTAALLRCKKETQRPVLIVAEGSTYLKQAGFQEKLAGYMGTFAGEKHGLSYQIQTRPDVVMKGIAAACLSR